MKFENIVETVTAHEGLQSKNPEEKYVSFYSYLLENRKAKVVNHCHTETELILVMRGKEKATIEGTVYELKQGDILVIPPYSEHSFEFDDGQKTSDIVNRFDADAVFSQTCGSAILEYRQQICTIRPLSSSWPENVRRTVTEYLLQINEIYAEKASGWELEITGLYLRLIAQLLYHVPHGLKAIGNQNMEKLRLSLEYMTCHYQEKITLKSCAAVAGFNPNYFSHYFAENMNMSVRTYLIGLRIRKARELLVNTDMTIGEIGTASGFEDIRTFNRNFFRETGLTPSGFRKQFRNSTNVKKKDLTQPESAEAAAAGCEKDL